MMYILDKGIVYQLGRDKSYRPLVFINVKKIDSVKENKEALTNALMYLLVLVREIMCLPYHIERWSLIIEANPSVVAKGTIDWLEEIKDLIRTNFPRTLENLYLFNIGSVEDLSKSIPHLANKYDKKRLVFVNNKYDQRFLEKMAKDQYERRFGGTIDDLVDDCYPPLATTFKLSGDPSWIDKQRNLSFFKMAKTDIFSNLIIHKTTTKDFPLAGRRVFDRSEKPNYSLSNSAATRLEGAVYIKDDIQYWKYYPGRIDKKTEHDFDAENFKANLGGGGEGYRKDQEVETKTTVIQDGPVKKIITEEIITTKLDQHAEGGVSGSGVRLGNGEMARTIKKVHDPIVSEKEKKKIQGLEKISLFNFIGCFGGKDKAFF